MSARRFRLWLGSLLLVFLMIQTVGVGAQCVTMVTNSGTTTTIGGMSAYFVTKTIGITTQCSLTMAMNVYDCYPGPTIGATASTIALQASALTTATNPSCQWDCNCGTVTVDNTDGLPVELMGFEIEG